MEDALEAWLDLYVHVSTSIMKLKDLNFPRTFTQISLLIRIRGHLFCKEDKDPSSGFFLRTEKFWFSL